MTLQLVARSLIGLLTALVCVQAGPIPLNPASVDTSLFRVTAYAQGLSGPLSISQFGTSLLVGTGLGNNTVFSFTSFNQPGVADGPGTAVYSVPNGGAVTALVKAGDYYFLGTSGVNGLITILQPGPTPSDPFTAVGSIQMNFPANWEHNQVGIAVRQDPGQPTGFDIVFNVGSQYDHQLSDGKVQLGGDAAGTLDGDALYMVHLNISGSSVTASNLQKVATGIRNVIGLGFEPNSGDFYFVDNAMDGPGPDGDEPPQAEELNRIAAAVLGTGTINFGYPTCYIQYRTGDPVGSGCQQPLATFQPLPNGTPLGQESEGPAQMVFAPPGFPTGYNNGVFIGFSGKAANGPENEENAVVYYDFGTGKYIHFVESGIAGVGHPIGLYSNSTSLYIADLTLGIVSQIDPAASVPEPGSALLVGAGVIAAGLLARRRASNHRSN